MAGVASQLADAFERGGAAAAVALDAILDGPGPIRQTRWRLVRILAPSIANAIEDEHTRHELHKEFYPDVAWPTGKELNND